MAYSSPPYSPRNPSKNNLKIMVKEEFVKPISYFPGVPADFWPPVSSKGAFPQEKNPPSSPFRGGLGCWNLLKFLNFHQPDHGVIEDRTPSNRVLVSILADC